MQNEVSSLYSTENKSRLGITCCEGVPDVKGRILAESGHFADFQRSVAIFYHVTWHEGLFSILYDIEG